MGRTNDAERTLIITIIIIIIGIIVNYRYRQILVMIMLIRASARTVLHMQGRFISSHAIPSYVVGRTDEKVKMKDN